MDLFTPLAKYPDVLYRLGDRKDITVDNCPSKGSLVTLRYQLVPIDAVNKELSVLNSSTADEMKFRLHSPSSVSKELHYAAEIMRRGETLMFHMPRLNTCYLLTLIDFTHTQKVTEDGVVNKTIIQTGTGPLRPNDDAVVVVKWTGRFNSEKGDIFHETKGFETITLGSVDLSIVPQGVENCIKNMYTGERCHVLMSGDYCQLKGSVDEEPPTLWYDIEVQEFKKGLESWQMDITGKIVLMKHRKEQGNSYFGAAMFKRAIEAYEIALKLFSYDEHLDTFEKEKVDALRATCYSNIAQCRMKQKDFVNAIATCHECLKYDPNHIKCLFRRGQCYAMLGEFNRAETDLMRAIDLSPGNKTISSWIVSVGRMEKRERNKERNMYSGIFDKIEKDDTSKEETLQFCLKTGKLLNSNSIPLLQDKL